MPVTSRAKASAKNGSSVTIGFEAKLWLTADIAVHGHVWIAGRYFGAEAVRKMVRGHQWELGYAS